MRKEDVIPKLVGGRASEMGGTIDFDSERDVGHVEVDDVAEARNLREELPTECLQRLTKGDLAHSWGSSKLFCPRHLVRWRIALAGAGKSVLSDLFQRGAAARHLPARPHAGRPGVLASAIHAPHTIIVAHRSGACTPSARVTRPVGGRRMVEQATLACRLSSARGALAASGSQMRRDAYAGGQPATRSRSRVLARLEVDVAHERRNLGAGMLTGSHCPNS